MHKNAQKAVWKTQSKISCYYTRLLHEDFLTASRPGRRSITAAKRNEKEKKERGKKFQKSKSLTRRSPSRLKILT